MGAEDRVAYPSLKQVDVPLLNRTLPSHCVGSTVQSNLDSRGGEGGERKVNQLSEWGFLGASFYPDFSRKISQLLEFDCTATMPFVVHSFFSRLMAMLVMAI